MPKLSDALISFGKLIGFMDTGGTVQWSWFGDPLKNSLTGMPRNRAQFGVMLQALLDETDTSEKVYSAAGNLLWERVTLSTAGIGIVWNKDSDPPAMPLQLGLGARYSTTIASQATTFGLLAQTIQIDPAGNLTSQFGQFSLDAGIPVPDFLKSASLTAAYTNHLELSLTATETHNLSKTLHVSPPSTTIPWDAARLAAFVVHAWVKIRAEANPADKGLFYRLDSHLFPMLGDGPTAGPIQPMPPVDAMESAPDFNKWKDSVLTTDADASGALTFLWHLRALITGNESPNVLTGSYYFPLIPDTTQPASFPPTTFVPTGTFPASSQSGAWLAFTYGSTPGDPMELSLVLRSDPAHEGRITIARAAGGVLERPSVPSGAAFTALSAVVASVLPLTIGTDTISTFAPPGGGLGIQLFSHTIADPNAGMLAGAYSLGFVLKDGEAIGYSAQSPLLALDFPLDNASSVAAELVSSLLHFFFSIVLTTPGSPLASAVNALLAVMKTALVGTSPSPGAILDVVKGIAGSAGPIEFGDHLSLSIGGAGVTPQISFGPFDGDALGDHAGVSIGSLDVSATLDPTQVNPLSTVSLGFTDVRLGSGGTPGATGVVAKLFPDLRQVTGFNISVSYTRGDSAPTVLGGGKIPIQRTLGPLEVVALLVEFRKDSFTVGVDLFFQLGPISVAVYELGVTVSYTSGASFFLNGLGVSFQGGGISLSGMFLKASGPGGTVDYVGGAVIDVESLFQLSAIGGYSDSVDGASMFIFASLSAPLGGPPFFFVTGIAGGFGFNRTLPPASLLSEHPFLKVMRGEISFNPNDPGSSLVSLAAAFTAQKGQYWIAAGIQFTCFAVINGKVIVAVSFGKKFSFNLLGMLTYGIQHIAYFELDFMVTADEEHFLLIAGMGPNSYLIDPDIFSLQGQFGMGVWYANGDFVISVGGYHPAYNKPAKYPELARVGVKAVVYNFIHVDVQCFFACTPQALMAGASVSLYAKFEGISAGLDVYVDVLITWDPFYIRATMGVTVWFHFMGRHEVGVDLEIYTPPFGGKAHIHIFVVSFTVSFGSGPKQPPPPPLPDFITGQLGVPAKMQGALTVLSAFNTATAAGLFRVDVTDGRATQVSGDGKQQEGIVSPIPVNSEFAFTVTTRLPIGEPGATEDMHGNPTLDGEIDVPLCDLMNIHSTFKVTAPKIENAGLTRLIDWFPAATFGEKLAPAQSGSSARDLIAGMSTDVPSIPLSDGIEIRYTAQEHGPSGFLAGTREEYSTAKEDMPLPLAWNRDLQQGFLTVKSQIRFSDVLPIQKIKSRGPALPRRTAAAKANLARANQPWKVIVAAGDIFRSTVAVDVRGFTVNNMLRGVTTVAVPTSPARRAELLPVALHLSPVQSPAPVRRFRIPVFTKVLNLTKVSLAVNGAQASSAAASTATPSGGAAASLIRDAGIRPATTVSSSLRKDLSSSDLSGIGKVVNVPPGRTPPVVVKKPDVSLTPTRAGHITIGGGRSGATHTLVTKGDATLRTIFLDRGGRVVGDTYATGPQNIPTPANTADVFLLHQGTRSPVATMRGLHLLVQNIGVESDTMAIAMGPRTFAAHGCVMRSHVPLPKTASLFDTLAGAELLRSLTNFAVTFPSLVRTATLILIVQPIANTPGPALDEIRWGSDGATLSGLMTVVGVEQTAFVCTVTAPAQWDLELDLGDDWRFASVVLSATEAADVMTHLRASADWDLIDDRVQTGDAPANIDINFEVAR